MNKEPIGLYIFRFILGLGLFAFMGMLYWSSVLLEEDVKFLRFDIAALKNDIFGLRSDTEKIREDVLKAVVEEFRQAQTPRNASEDELSASPKAETLRAARSAFGKRPHIDPALPNLLEEDSFYAETLPKLLGSHFKPSGVLHGDTIGKPDNLHPFSNWAQVANWIDQCTVSVAKQQFGKYETLSPDMAIKMEARPGKNSKGTEFWVHLREGVYWEPLNPELFAQEISLAPHFLRKHPVTAHDFKFHWDAMMNPYVEEAGAVALRTYYGDIEAIEVIDPLTFVVRWKAEEILESNGTKVPKVKYIAKQLTGGMRPLASFVYQYFPDGKKIIDEDSNPSTYRTNSVWAQNFSQHWAKNIIISCGPWLFQGMTERQIKFRRNPNYYFPLGVLVNEMIVEFKDAPTAIWADFQARKIDTYGVQPDQLIELESFLQSASYQEQAKQGYGVKRLDYLPRLYTYVGWNEAKPYFKTKKVRQALTMAIDRQRIIQEYLNGMGVQINGTFFRNSSAYDSSIAEWPFNLQKARSLLEEEGWYDSTGSGTLDKVINGQKVPFRFSLTYFVKNPILKAICEYIATTLKEIGILCNLNGVDIADLSAAFEDKSFDAICLSWSLGTPPEDPKQIWYSKGAKEKGSSNAIGFANPEIDAIIEKLQYEYDPQKRTELYHSFDAIIHEEAPYTFLYTPKVALVYRQYLQNVFIPADRQDLIPGANATEPDNSIFWIKTNL